MPDADVVAFNALIARMFSAAWATLFIGIFSTMAARMNSNNTFEWTGICRAWLQFIVLMTVPLMALGVECSKSQELAAETEAGSLNSWAAVHRSFARYGHCDDGAIGEGYSDSVTILLADHWDALPQLTTLAAGDSTFRAFVLKHIDATVPSERLERIANHARSRCPRQHGDLCAAIIKRTRGGAQLSR